MELHQIEMIGAKIFQTLIDALRNEPRIPFVEAQAVERASDVPALGEKMKLAAAMRYRLAG